MGTTTESSVAAEAQSKTMTGFVEHVNVTVSDPHRTAAMLRAVFGWEIRWQGSSRVGGQSIHVGQPGNGSTYLALYGFATEPGSGSNTYAIAGGLNHIGVVVADLDAAEARAIAAGYRPHHHDDYEPGRRFYFNDHDNIEFEVVSYN